MLEALAFLDHAMHTPFWRKRGSLGCKEGNPVFLNNTFHRRLLPHRMFFWLLEFIFFPFKITWKHNAKMFSNLSGSWENVQSLQEKKGEALGTGTDPQQRKAHLCDFRKLFGIYYFGFPVGFKFSTADGSPYLQALSSALSPLSPGVFFIQLINRHPFDSHNAGGSHWPSSGPLNQEGIRFPFKGTMAIPSALLQVWVLYFVGSFRDCEMAQWVSLLAAKPECQRPILITHRVEREDRLPQVFL